MLYLKPLASCRSPTALKRPERSKQCLYFLIYESNLFIPESKKVSPFLFVLLSFSFHLCFFVSFNYSLNVTWGLCNFIPKNVGRIYALFRKNGCDHDCLKLFEPFQLEICVS